MLRRFILFIFALCLTASAHAITIVGYNPDLHDRFDSGFPSAPVINSSAGSVAASYDLSGVGWDTALPTRAITMISDQYFVYSAHYGIGSEVSFVTADGTVLTYTVDTSYTFEPTAEIADALGDLRIGRLTTTVSSSIASYAILDLGDTSEYQGLSLLVYGHGDGTEQTTAPWYSPRIGTNTSEGLVDVNLGGGVIKKGLVYDQDSSIGEALLQAGDSGSPTFTVVDGQLVLVGIHYGVGGTTSVDDLIALYLDSMASSGIEFSTVPEPRIVVLVFFAFVAIATQRRRDVSAWKSAPAPSPHRPTEYSFPGPELKPGARPTFLSTEGKWQKNTAVRSPLGASEFVGSMQLISAPRRR